MPAPTYGTDIPNGFAGVPASTPDRIINNYINVSDKFIKNGDVVLKSTGGVIPADATATIANFCGFAMRQVQTQIDYSDQNGAGSYAPQAPVPVLSRGETTMLCHVGSPALFGAVYLRQALNSSIPTGVVGGLEANEDGGNSIVIPGCEWGSTIDANGNATVLLKVQN
jgi:hypothetical protein